MTPTDKDKIAEFLKPAIMIAASLFFVSLLLALYLTATNQSPILIPAHMTCVKSALTGVITCAPLEMITNNTPDLNQFCGLCANMDSQTLQYNFSHPYRDLPV